MSNQEPVQSTTNPPLQKERHLLEDLVLLVLIMFTMVGIYISDVATANIDGYLYWMVMIVVFAISAMLINIVQSKHKQVKIKDILVEQSLHWFGTILALFGVLLLVQAETLTHDNAALVYLLILSLSTFLDGIRIGWRFSLIGNYLGLAAVIMAFVENPMWILYIIALLLIMAVYFFDKKNLLQNQANQPE